LNRNLIGQGAVQLNRRDVSRLIAGHSRGRRECR
jgi:hypothetical protein